MGNWTVKGSVTYISLLLLLCVWESCTNYSLKIKRKRPKGCHSSKHLKCFLEVLMWTIKPLPRSPRFPFNLHGTLLVCHNYKPVTNFQTSAPLRVATLNLFRTSQFAGRKTGSTHISFQELWLKLFLPQKRNRGCML